MDYSGLKIVGFRADETACGMLRVEYPLRYLKERGAFTDIITQVSPEYLAPFDFILAQRQYNPHVLDILAQAQENGKIVIFEVDDLLHDVHPTSPAYHVYKRGTEELKNAERCIGMAHGLTVTTHELAAEYLKYNRNTYVIPNCIDFKLRNWTEPVSDRDEGLVVLWSGGTCGDSQTEVLSENGFKLFKDLLPNEKVATLNVETQELEYQEPTEYINIPYKGKMHLVEKMHINYCMTPNHYMYVAKMDGKGKKSNLKYSLRQSKDIFGTPFYCNKTAKWLGEEPKTLNIAGVDFKTEDWLKFFGFWLAEGWTTKCESTVNGKTHKCKQVGIFQGKGNAIVLELKSIMESYGYYVGLDRNQCRITISNPLLWEYLRLLGTASEKYIPKELLNLSPRLLKILLEYYLKGDGSAETGPRCTKPRLRAYTTSKRLADNLIELALKIGWAANLTNRGKRDGSVNGRIIKANYNQLVISFLRNDGPYTFLKPLVTGKDQKEIDYEGTVHCVTVPNHTLYCRRKGKAFWTGNTHQQDLPLLGSIVKRMLETFPQIRFNICTNPMMATEAIKRWDIEKFNDRIRILKDRPIQDYPQIWSYGDISIAPLNLHPFNLSKCLDENTLVSTKSGLIRMKSLTVGQEIWNKDHWTKIEAIEKQSKAKGLKITLDHGFELLMTKEHKMPTTNDLVKEAQDLNVGDTLYLSQTQFAKNYLHIPYQLWQTRWSKHYNNLDDWTDSKSLPIIKIDEHWGKWLGYFLGDGSCTKVAIKISTDGKDPDVAEDIRETLRHLGLASTARWKTTFDKTPVNCLDIGVSSSKLLEFMDYIGVCKDKEFSKTKERILRVPEVIFQSPKSVVTGFLQSLFESDACASECELSSKSKEFILDIQQLLMLYGITGYISPWTYHSKIKEMSKYNGNIYWKIRLKRHEKEIFYKEIGFVGKRKQDILKSKLDKKWSNHSKPISFEKKIVAIEPCELNPIDIQTTDGYFVANSIVSHNSSLKILEAGTWGVPTVATRIAPYCRLIEDGVNGYLATGLNEWMEKLGILIEDTEKRKAMGQTIKAQVYDQFDYDKNIDNWVNTWYDIAYRAETNDLGPGPNVNMKIGRNDSCPCGRGKTSYKDCCFPGWERS